MPPALRPSLARCLITACRANSSGKPHVPTFERFSVRASAPPRKVTSYFVPHPPMTSQSGTGVTKLSGAQHPSRPGGILP